jgi:hypothetical protein
MSLYEHFYGLLGDCGELLWDLQVSELFHHSLKIKYEGARLLPGQPY